MFCDLRGSGRQPPDDLSAQPVKSGHVYAIAVDGEDRVKRLVPLISGDMLVQSDNENYPTEKLTREEWDARVQVIGRVIDRSGSGWL